ncbi:MAG: hypothetical protein A2X61_14585 [Ignavibacteria bacterium GWB2_35_12]|nr:MAG: hypothetical protein A2X63_01555 [Ignavibacteria bacterium GWA2_35_8]OGU42658.1 MAG: hypothetical protein A2X61_14585 [Ignavibacteria bacterium GWB2_35_12]OGU88283.1 MAG: hypothetical protein A2220_14635 [Ignavibacteria bacterium RIFOXYA2_FULL_35_10]OGV19180.1 MAG: hypothetical protein A2475_15380 [Ignavibacteria bacterium RIFOXYC2_FULL_35_21]
MKVLKIILIILVSLFALIVLVGLLLPSNIKLERKITIDAPPAVVFDLLNDLHNFHQWSPFSELDTNMKIKVSGTSGVGSTYEWNSKGEAGIGKITIKESVPNKLIKCQLDFAEEGTSFANFKIMDEKGKTTLTWDFETDLGGSPFTKYFGLFMEPMMGPQYEKGLKSFKKLAEKTFKMIADLPITIEQFPGRKLYSITDSCKMEMSEISNAFTKAYKELGEFCMKNKIQCTEAPVAIMNSFDKIYSFEAAFAIIDNKRKGEGRIFASSLPAGKVVKAVYTGPYDKMMSAYDKVMAFIKENKLEINGRAWEQYISDPASTPNDKLITHIYFPVE